MRGRGWQAPAEGLTEQERLEFFKLITKRDEHWYWEGPRNAETPAFLFRGALVSAVRIAWALTYPASQIPGILFRNKARCCEQLCISPEHRTRQDKEIVSRAETGTGMDDIAIPRAIEALAHLQFGTPVSKRQFRRALVTEPAELVTEDGPIEVPPPKGLVAYEPTSYDLQNAPKLTAQELVDLLFQPNTVVMTFESGHVWISSPKGRVEGLSPQEAILGFMINSGAHKAHG